LISQLAGERGQLYPSHSTLSFKAVSSKIKRKVNFIKKLYI